jgi:peptide deformylase
MIRPIVKIPNPILRQKAKPVTEVSDEIRQLLRDMEETMYDEPGVGLAAPQVGVSLQAIVYDSPEDKEGCRWLLNPIIKRSEGQNIYPEGCLSIPNITADVERATMITVEGMLVSGEKVSLDLTDFTARILQHEIDHLNGILFIDRVGPAERSLIQKKLKKYSASAPRL